MDSSKAFLHQDIDNQVTSKDNKPKHLRLCSWNIWGLTEAKLHKDALGNFLNDYDIIALQETWHTKSNKFEVDLYKSFHAIKPDLHPRAKRGSGGISVYVKHNLSSYVTLLKKSNDNIMWLKFKTFSDSDLAIGVIYFPPNIISKEEDIFLRLKSDISLYKQQYKVLLIGDFNGRIKLKSDIPDVVKPDVCFDSVPLHYDYFPDAYCKERLSEDCDLNDHGKCLIQLCKACDIRILNGRCFNDRCGKFTYCGTSGKSVVDYAIVDSSVAKLVTDFEVGRSYPESDHRPLLVKLDLNCNYNDGKESIDEGLPIYNYMWNKQTLSDLEYTLSNETFTDLMDKFYMHIKNCENVNVVSESWYDYFTACVENVFDKKLIRTRKAQKAPWYDHECIEKRKQLLCNEGGNQNELFGQYRSFLQKKRRNYKQKLLDDLEEKLHQDPTGFWTSFNSLQRNCTQIKLTPVEICEKLETLSKIPYQEHFDYQFEKEVTDFINSYDDGIYDKCVKDKTMCDILNSPIQVDEVVSAVQKLKPGKSPGIDRFPVDFIKCSIHSIKYHLMSLFNYVLDKEEYPDKWGDGLRVVIPKGDDDIRPITIEPLFAKIFETVLDGRICFVNEAFKKTDIYNGGFRKGTRTQDNLLILTSCIEKQLAIGEKLYVAFVDFKKAFNYINHVILIYKLIKLGMSGRFVNIIKSMYSKIKGIIKVNNRLYNTIDDTCGSNQGGPLSPNMFRYMLSDLREYLDITCGINLDGTMLVHLLWADDLVLMSPTAEGLQKQLNGLQCFTSKFQMIVNEVKTKVVIFGNLKTEMPVFTFNQKKLEIVDDYKYLGVTINSVKTSRGNLFKTMVDYICDKSSKAIFHVYNKCKPVGRATPSLSIKMYDSYVSPVLNYACEIWGNFKPIPDVERVLLRYLKFMLGVKSGTCSAAIYGETGCYPVYIQHIIRTIKYWVRVRSLPSSELVRKAYDVSRLLCLTGFKTWSCKVRDILELYGMGTLWTNETGVINTNDFIKHFKDCVYNNYISLWQADVKNFPVLRTYMTFKTEFGFEQYLVQVKDYKLRKVMSQFRLSSHKLCIETGRHSKPKIPLNDRICSHCNLTEIEDEEHLLLHCPFYSEERVHLFYKILTNEGSIFDGCPHQVFINIMSSTNGNVIFSLSKYLFKCFKKKQAV